MTKNYLENQFDVNGLAEVFDEVVFWSAPFGLKLLDYVTYRTKITAVDLGCGTGFPLLELASRLGESCTIYGIDPWREGLQRVQLKLDYYQIKQVQLSEGSAEKIPLREQSVDLLVSNNCLNNVENLPQAIDEVARIMRTKGQFLQTMNLNQTMFEFYQQLEEILLELKLDSEIIKMREHINHKRRPVEEMLRLLKEAGFLIKDLEYDQFNYQFADGTAMLGHHFVRLAFLDVWKSFLPVAYQRQIFAELEVRLNQQAEQFGVLKMSVPYVVINAIKR